MKKERMKIENTPAIFWGEKSDRIYIYVHGKMSSKEDSRAGQQHLLFLSDSSQQSPFLLRVSSEKDDGKTSKNE